MTDRLLALLTKKLIDRCGGLAEASAACSELARYYSVPQLSRCTTPGAGCYLPLDILAALERYCGVPVISQALAQQSPVEAGTERLADLACAFSEQALDVQKFLRTALADRVLTPREIKRGLDEAMKCEDAIAVIKASLLAADKAT
jgi:hypothetical protein